MEERETRRLYFIPHDGKPISEAAKVVIAAHEIIKKHASDKGVAMSLILNELTKLNLNVDMAKRYVPLMARVSKPLFQARRMEVEGARPLWTDFKTLQDKLPDSVDLRIPDASRLRRSRDMKGTTIMWLNRDSNAAHDIKAIFKVFKDNPGRVYRDVPDLENDLKGKLFSKISGYMPYLVLARDAPLHATRTGKSAPWKNIRQIRDELPSDALMIDWDSIGKNWTPPPSKPKSEAPVSEPAPTPVPAPAPAAPVQAIEAQQIPPTIEEYNESQLEDWLESLPVRVVKAIRRLSARIMEE